MIMCVLCYPVSIHMSQLLSTGRPISNYNFTAVRLILYPTLQYQNKNRCQCKTVCYFTAISICPLCE